MNYNMLGSGLPIKSSNGSGSFFEPPEQELFLCDILNDPVSVAFPDILKINAKQMLIFNDTFVMTRITSPITTIGCWLGSEIVSCN